MSDPLHTPTMLLKNNLNIKTPGGEKTPGEKIRYFPRKLLQDVENDPPSSMISPSKFAVVRQLVASRSRGPLEDHDTNSQDSGISDDSKSNSEFRFAEPCGAAPRRLSSVDMSPLRLRGPRTGTPDKVRLSPRVRPSKVPEASPKRSLVFSSDSAMSLSSFSSESTDDGFMEFFQADKLLDEDTESSGSRLGNLLSAKILTNSTPPRSPPRRGTNHQRSLTENISPTKTDIFTLKRPLLFSSHSSTDATTPLSKKHKPLVAQDLNVVPSHERGTLFQYGFKKSPACTLNSGLPSPPYSITPEPTSPPRATTPSTSCQHSIKLGLQRSTTEELIGDFSRPFALPLLAKDHDLKTISCDTLAKLIRGEYMETVSSYKIIDCRYPYEYDGGHIKGAVNLYRRDQITQELHTRQRENSAKLSRRRMKQKAQQTEGKTYGDEPVQLPEQLSSEETLAVKLSDSEDATEDSIETPRLVQTHSSTTCSSPKSNSASSPLKERSDSEGSDPDARHILVFHCEYSAERGPSLYRCLRQEDRAGNPYPQLTYPELYLLEGGYNAFFSSFSDLCEPQSYKPMIHPEHVQDLRNFRAKSKSWAGKHHKKLSVRSLSRL